MTTRGPKVTVRRIDQSYRVLVLWEGLEHTHHRPLTEKRAWNLVDRVREALDDGRDLNLAHWHTQAS